MTGDRRTSTWRCDIRQAPSARNTISTTGNSSGSSDIAVAMPTSSASCHPPRNRPNATTTAAAAVRPSTATTRTRRSTSRCRGVRSVSMSRSALPIRPSSVFAPVPRTTAIARPFTTRVPEKTHGVPSPPGAPIVVSPARAPPAAALRTGTLSPVSNDSSTVQFTASSRTASAGTRSPSDSISTSSRTTSRPAIRSWRPARTTSARGDERSRSAASAFSVLCSWAIEIPTTTNTATSRMIPSSNSANSRLIAPAATSSNSIGSRNTSSICRARFRRASVGSSFGPSTASRSAATASVSPVPMMSADDVT